MKQTYSGGCQCGKVRYEASFAARRGDLLQLLPLRTARLTAGVPPKEGFKLLAGEGAMFEYQFDKHSIHHLFCATCGIQSFAHGKRPDGAEMVAVNARCLDGVDVDSLKVKKVDGRKL